RLLLPLLMPFAFALLDRRRPRVLAHHLVGDAAPLRNVETVPRHAGERMHPKPNKQMRPLVCLLRSKPKHELVPRLAADADGANDVVACRFRDERAVL